MNSKENGVCLPTCQYAEDLDDQPAVHSGRHLRDYVTEVERRLRTVNTKERALDVINDLREELCKNEIKVQNKAMKCK